jgi:hypothetical protein
MIKTLAFILSASLAAACAGQAEVRYSGNASVPELVAMEGDTSVMVVANSDEPLFYVDNTYWLYRDDAWFRSSSHRKGWVKVDSPPDRIRRIDRPHAYVHLRHTPDAQRTTLNQRNQTDPQRSEDSAEPTDREQLGPDRTSGPDQPSGPDQTPGLQPNQPRPMTDPARDPMRDPSSQGPNQPYPNPPPPNQVPPSPDSDPSLRPPQSTRPVPNQVPAPTPDRTRPDSQIAPDPDRGPISPPPAPNPPAPSPK